MRLVFWQNCISPHQLPYIVELVNDKRVDTVDIIVGESISGDRKLMGWELPPEMDEKKHIRGCNVYIHPDCSEMEMLLSKRINESVHLFSGIRAFEYVFNVFNASLKYNVKRGIITERPNTFAFGLTNGKPLWLHKIRFGLQDRKFIPYIHYIFAIGRECENYYSSISKDWKVFPFAYCTASPQINNSKLNVVADGNCRKEERLDTINLLYVGSLSWRKNVRLLLVACREYCNFCIDLVGDGPQRRKLETIASKCNLKNVRFWGYKKNSEIPAIMASHDVLVLPSIYDGWGAVINEALMNGLYVICSDKCGAKDILRNKRIGMVFRGGETEELSNCLLYVETHIDEIRQDRPYRKKWSEEHISGKAIAMYMVSCLYAEVITPPWQK
jgi:glycosyltransferase involved in cell wall biosynthesis